jgi:Helix-turn-helix domain
MPSSVPSSGSPTRAASSAATCALFRDLRTYLQLTPEQLSARLRTPPQTILALETGDLATLPPWHETARVVMEYAALAGIDGSHALLCLKADLMPVAPAAGAPPRAAVLAASPVPNHPPVVPVPQAPQAILPGRRPSRPHRSEAEPVHRAATLRGNLAKPIRWLVEQLSRRAIRRVAVVGCVLALLDLSSPGAFVEARVAQLPAPVAKVVRTATDVLFQPFQRKFEGMTWIDPADPRTRRGDKLATTKR